MKRICTICARGGSKGVKNKNIRVLHGIPLLAYTIQQARDSGLFNAIALSSDSEEILNIGRQYSVDYLIMRPTEMASDTAAKIPAIRHCFLEAERLAGTQYDTAVDLDATSPLRVPEDIVQAVKILENSGVSNVITAMPSRRSPYFNLIELTDDGKIVVSKQLEKQIVRRQDSPQCFDMNASIYVWQREALLEHNTVFLKDTALYIMPEERSIDIDSELDFEFVEFIMGKRVEKI